MDKDDAQSQLRAVGDLRGIYRHRKGGVYTVYSTSVNEATGEVLVHYYSPARKSRWTRTLADFTEEVEGRPRFWKVGEGVVEDLLEAADLAHVDPGP